ncbi:MAG: serine/threonine-protein kinase [Polyangia bacterium]|jgi:serine/threonine protein kinase|nr:serine/threonine-protein kinase [Polyangia bacterium]
MGEAVAKVIDRYELVRLLGEGGMGAVYEARHALVGNRYALKVLRSELASDDKVVRRMMREARAAAEIGHPNIVQTHDFGTLPDGTCYIAMELLEGESLDAMIVRHGQMEVEISVAIVLQVLSALVAAHGKGIIHRDLKPENVFIARLNVGGAAVKLLDFGISKFKVTDKDTLKLTHTGVVMGTPFYMSPEQAGGAKDVDERTDLWAVGVILYQMLTGQLPFTGDNYNQLILKIATKPFVAPRRHNPAIPERLEAVIVRALQKDLSNRFRRATQMIEALLPFYNRGETDAGRFLLREDMLKATPRRSKERLVVSPYGQTGSTPSQGSDPGTDPTIFPEDGASRGTASGPDLDAERGFGGVQGIASDSFDGFGSGERELLGRNTDLLNSGERPLGDSGDQLYEDGRAIPASRGLRDSNSGVRRTAAMGSGRIVRLGSEELMADEQSPAGQEPSRSLTPRPASASASGPQRASEPSATSGRSRFPLVTIVLGLVAVGAIAALAVILTRQDKSSPGSTESAKPRPAVEASMEEPRVVEREQRPAEPLRPVQAERPVDPSKPIAISITGLPEKATVKLNGYSVTPPIKVLPNGEKHRLQISAPGFEDLTTEFTAEPRLQTLPIVMVEKAGRRGHLRAGMRTERGSAAPGSRPRDAWDYPVGKPRKQPSARPTPPSTPVPMSAPPPPPEMRPRKTTDGVYGNPYGD